MKYTIYRLTLIFVMLAMAVSCVTPGYKTPKNLISDKTFRDGSTDTTTIAAINWSTYYGDRYLQKLISQALDSNINLQLSISRVKQANEYFKKARVAFVPNFNVGAQATVGKPSKYGTTPVGDDVKMPLTDYQLTASASWEIDVWGKLRSSKRAAYADLLSTQSAKDAVVTQLIADMASAYYQLVVMDAKLKVTEKTITNYTDYLAKVSVMKEQAQTNEVAVLQAKAQLYGAQSYLPQIKASISIFENYICLLIGKSGGFVERSESLDLTSINNSDMIGIPTQLLQYRPDVRTAEFKMRAAHESFNMAKASMYPSLKISGQIGFEGMEIEKWFDPKSLFWNVVGGITEPLFNGRALRTQKNIAALQKEDSYLEFRLNLLNATSEVSNAILQTKSSAEKAKYTKLQCEALNNAFNYSIELFERGYGTYLDVLSAQNGLFSSELSLYDSYLEVANQKIELYRALGGGWRN
ncbi:MAG: TolC family protein [Rikenellaceae bacterium]